MSNELEVGDMPKTSRRGFLKALTAGAAEIGLVVTGLGRGVARAKEEESSRRVTFTDLIQNSDIPQDFLDQFFKPYLQFNVGDTIGSAQIKALEEMPNFSKVGYSMLIDSFYFSFPGYEGREWFYQDAIKTNGVKVIYTKTTVYPLPGDVILTLDDVSNLGSEDMTKQYKNGAVSHIFINQGLAVTCLPNSNTIIKVEFFTDPEFGFPDTSDPDVLWWWSDNGKDINEF